MKGALGNLIPLPVIFRGVTWFVGTDLITLCLLIAFPIISLYLPGLME
jgi:TRAP-type C4-dicarboxylate transport system permease large subunit